MVLHPELLDKAQATGTRLAEAERQATLARAEHHTAIRRLHLAGGSLREIAQALGVSHQRVQQIVEAGGGTWWQRVWRTRQARRDAVCTFCERPPSEVSKLIAGPDVYVCDGCVALAEGVLAGAGGGDLLLVKEGARASCSFCGKRSARDRAMVATRRARLCAGCLRLCREILDGRSGAPGR